MNILALDTSLATCSVALSHAGTIISRSVQTERQHNELILPMIESVLKEAGLSLQDVNAIAFGQGPGSFTGVRIATCVAQAIAYVHALPVIAVSSLATLAQGVYKKTGAKNIAIALDARVNSVYFGVYQVDEQKLVQTISEVQCPAAAVSMPAGDYLCVGDAWGIYSLQHGSAGLYPDPISIDARDMLDLAEAKFATDEVVNATDAVPIYFTDAQWCKKAQ